MYVCGIQTYVCMCVCTLKIRVYIYICVYICIVKIYITINVYIRNLANSNYIGYSSIYTLITCIFLWTLTNISCLQSTYGKTDQFIVRIALGTISIILVTGPVDEEKSGSGEHQLWRAVKIKDTTVFTVSLTSQVAKERSTEPLVALHFFRSLVWNSTFLNIPFVCIQGSYGTFFLFTLDPMTKMLGLPASASHDGTTPLARDSLVKFWVDLSVTNPGVGPLLIMKPTGCLIGTILMVDFTPI